MNKTHETGFSHGVYEVFDCFALQKKAADLFIEKVARDWRDYAALAGAGLGGLGLGGAAGYMMGKPKGRGKAKKKKEAQPKKQERVQDDAARKQMGPMGAVGMEPDPMGSMGPYLTEEDLMRLYAQAAQQVYEVPSYGTYF